MKILAGTEERDQRCIMTSSGIATAARGDFVMVIVVKRYEDVAAAMKIAADLLEVKPVEVP